MNETAICNQKMKELGCCILIPTYNNASSLAEVLEDVLAYSDDIIIVNDGSTDETRTILVDFESKITLVSYPKNQGKGHALRQGFKKAVELGFEYAITLDSDGQHKAKDLPLFLEKIEETPQAFIMGARDMQQTNVPGKSRFGYNFSNWWFKLFTGIALPDTQSGYRLYPVQRLKKMPFFTKKYEFEVEVLVRSAWEGIPIEHIFIQVFYPPPSERISHFRPVKDFIRIFSVYAAFLTVGLLYVFPFRFFRKLKKKI